MKTLAALCAIAIMALCACSSGDGADAGAGTGDGGADAGAATDVGGAGGDAGASDGGDDTGAAIDNRETCASGIAASYGPGDRFTHDFYSEIYPFPNGYYTVADATSPTGVRLDYPVNTMPLDMNEQFGFGTFGFLMEKFFVMGNRYPGMFVSIDAASLPSPAASAQAGASFFLVPKDEFLAKPAAELGTFAVPLEFLVNQRTGTVFARNREILRESTEYVFVITNAVKVDIVDAAGVVQEKGLCVAAPDNFRAVRSPTPIAADTPFSKVEPLRASLQPYFEKLERDYQIPRNTIASLSVFKTSVNLSLIKDLRAKAAAAESFNVKITGAVLPIGADGKRSPALNAHIPCAADEVNFDDYVYDSLEAMVTGTFDAPQFCCVGDRFNRDAATGEFKVLTQETLEFVLFLPKADPARGIAPPYPLVVFHHAFQVCKETLMGLAGELARFGFASASFDMVRHGSRAHKANCADGRLFCDTSATDFINAGDMSATVAYLGQTLLDDLAFAEMLKGLSVDVSPATGDPVTGVVDLGASGDGAPDVDVATPFGFVSQSLGSYLGSTVVALEPAYDRAVINVGLGAFYKFILEGIKPGADMNFLDESTAGYIMGVQTVCDRVEAMNATPLLAKAPAAGRAPVNVLYQGALNDEVIPHSGTDLISWALGLEQVDARRVVPEMPQVQSPRRGSYLGDDTTLGYFQYPDAEHIFFLASKHPGTRESAQFQAAGFLRTALDGKKDGKGGLIIDPFVCTQGDDLLKAVEDASGITAPKNDFCK